GADDEQRAGRGGSAHAGTLHLVTQIVNNSGDKSSAPREEQEATAGAAGCGWRRAPRRPVGRAGSAGGSALGRVQGRDGLGGELGGALPLREAADVDAGDLPGGAVVDHGDLVVLGERDEAV